MAKLNLTADPTHVPAKPTFELMPVGDYLLHVVSCDRKETSVGKALNVSFQVLDGSYKNRRIWVLYNLVHPDAEVVQRAYDQMQDLFKALGLVGEVDTDQLLQKPLIGRIYLTKPKPGYEQKNGVNKFRPANMLYPAAQTAEPAPPPAPAQPLTASERARALIAKHRAAAAASGEPPF